MDRGGERKKEEKKGRFTRFKNPEKGRPRHRGRRRIGCDVVDGVAEGHGGGGAGAASGWR